VTGLFYFPRPSPATPNRAYRKRNRKSRKGETPVQEKNETTNTAEKAAGLGISLDSWAVALALGLALLVWVGLIKHVPW
jgi:uncharacterized protein HemX